MSSAGLLLANLEKPVWDLLGSAGPFSTTINNTEKPNNSEEIYPESTRELNNALPAKMNDSNTLILGLITFSYADEAFDRYIASEQSTCEDNGMLAYEDGNYQRAFKKYMICAEAGDELSQYMVGIMYKNGQGVNQDYKKAFDWVSKSANQGYYFAQHKLTEFYELGIGVLKDDKSAFSWNLKAAEQGHAISQYNAAQNYREGRGVLKNYKKAVTWYKKAAEQEFTLAQTA